jgi:hypothetical protein
MEIAIGIILCLLVFNFAGLLGLMFMVAKMRQVQEQQITKICNIEDSIKSINEFLGDEAEANINQN